MTVLIDDDPQSSNNASGLIGVELWAAVEGVGAECVAAEDQLRGLRRVVRENSHGTREHAGNL